MCRFLAYTGPDVSLSEFVLDAPHSLSVQAYAPKHQSSGTINADGFGAGWYAPDRRPEPGLYRSDKPIWSDTSFASFSPLIRTSNLLAAVRDATPPLPVEVSNTPPFTYGGYLFAHNGRVEGFFEGTGAHLKKLISDAAISSLIGSTDSELIFAILRERLADLDPVEAMRRTISEVLGVSDARLNLVLHDGWQITAARHKDSLFVLEGSTRRPGAVVVASEPFDDDPAWSEVEEGSIVSAYCGGTVRHQMIAA